MEYFLLVVFVVACTHPCRPIFVSEIQISGKLGCRTRLSMKILLMIEVFTTKARDFKLKFFKNFMVLVQKAEEIVCNK
jgi:hypothetical protein